MAVQRLPDDTIKAIVPYCDEKKNFKDVSEGMRSAVGFAALYELQDTDWDTFKGSVAQGREACDSPIQTSAVYTDSLGGNSLESAIRNTYYPQLFSTPRYYILYQTCRRRTGTELGLLHRI